MSALGIKMAIYAAIALAISGAVGTLAVKSYNRGFQHAINLIAAKDKAAIKEADRASENLADCDARNGSWDVVTGRCE